jgi:hypothetical protein
MHGVEWIARTPPKRQVEGSNPSEPVSILSLYLCPPSIIGGRRTRLTLTTTTTIPTYEPQHQANQMRKNPMTVFAYALKAPESRRQYPRRLKIFLDYLGLEGNIEEQAKQFYLSAISNHAWAEESLMAFIAYEKERSKNGEISDSTIPNYYRETKLFCEMNDITLNWKKIAI